MPYDKLKQRLQAITKSEDRTLLKTIYASLGRVGEIMNPRYTETYPGKGLTGKDLEVTPTTLTISLITEKRNVLRRVPIARVDAPEHKYFKNNESWLADDIITCCVPFENKNIWDYSTRWAELRFEKYFKEFGQHIHLLRHWRATHLLTGKASGVPVPMHIVAKMGGWKGTKVLSETYDSSVIEDYWGI